LVAVFFAVDAFFVPPMAELLAPLVLLVLLAVVVRLVDPADDDFEVDRFLVPVSIGRALPTALTTLPAISDTPAATLPTALPTFFSVLPASGIELNPLSAASIWGGQAVRRCMPRAVGASLTRQLTCLDFGTMGS
jgi:hypothetical protein